MSPKSNKQRRCLVQFALLAPATFTLKSLYAAPVPLPSLSLATAITPEIRASLLELFGSSKLIGTNSFDLRLPIVSENPEVVPVSITVALNDIAAIAVYLTSNAPPLAVLLHDTHQTLKSFSTRIRVKGNKANVIAVVATRRGELFANVKATRIWGCLDGGG